MTTLSSGTRPLIVLHVDDDIFERERLQEALQESFQGQQFQVEGFSNAEDYRRRLTSLPRPDMAILDINIDEEHMTGVRLVGETRRRHATIPIIMCSTMDDFETISRCLQEGADDFMSKTSDKHEIALRVANAHRLVGMRRGAVRPGAVMLSPRLPRGKTMDRVAQRIPLLIDSAVSAIHVTGPSGAGKEVVADMLAAALPEGTPFVRVNCGAIAPTLLQSELFGYAKGAFTGATSAKTGLIEAAHGGWIFLDEVATLTPEAQVALLRVLENRELIRVGETHARSVDVRVLSATNESLSALSAAGKFRGDLWQRLCETDIVLPPLAERSEEIEALVHHFCATMHGGPYTITQPALEILVNLPWRNGNVRELRNTLRAMTECHIAKTLTPLSIPEKVWEQVAAGKQRPSGPTAGAPTPVANADAPLAGELNLSIRVPDGQPIVYDTLADILLADLIRSIVGTQGQQSLRSLAKTINMSRSTLSGRLRAMQQSGILSARELADLAGLSEV